MRFACIGLLFVVSYLPIGCAAHPLDDVSWAKPRPLGDAHETYHASADPRQDAPKPSVPDVPSELKLRDALALSLAESPELAGFAWEVRAAEANMVQQGLWQNPELEVEFENFAGSEEFEGTDSLETTVSLSQSFPLGGDVKRRQELAGYQARRVGWDYEAARIDLMVRTTSRFIAVLAAQRSVGFAEENLRLVTQLRDSIDRRIEAGAAPQVEAARAAVPVATAQVALKQAKRTLEATRQSLALTWGHDEPRFVSAAGNLDELHDLPQPRSLVVLINQNPQVARWVTEVSAHQAERRLAEAQAVPDLTIGLGIKHENASDSTGLVAGISLPLPLFDRQQGTIREASLNVRAAQKRQRAAELRVQESLSRGYLAMAVAHDEATALRDIAIPAAQKAFEATLRAFEQGNLGYLDLLDAERTLVELRSRQLDALIQYHMAVAEIEGLIGQSLRSLNDLTNLETNE